MTHFSDAPTRPRIPFGIRPRRADPVVLRLLGELREPTRPLYPMKYTESLMSGRGSASRGGGLRETGGTDKEEASQLGENVAHDVFPLNVAFFQPVMTLCREMNL